MHKMRTFWNKAVRTLRDFFAEPLTLHTVIVALSISIFIVLEAGYPPIAKLLSRLGFDWLEVNYPIFATVDDKEFSKGFVEWFGTFYSFFLPLLLLRAWEQLDRADREFDREADAIKVLLEDIMLLDNETFLELKKHMVRELNTYVQHVIDNYRIEHRAGDVNLKRHGDSLLQGIRVNYKDLIYRGGGKRASLLEPVTTELLNRLNDAIDTRGDRISIFSQRLFESLRLVAIVTSVIWLIPFYFLPFESGILGSFLKLIITFLIIFVLTVINDLDDPFTGYWKVSTASWADVQKETSSSLEELTQSISEARTTINNEANQNSLETKKITTHPFPLSLWVRGLSLIYLLFSPPRHDRE